MPYRKHTGWLFLFQSYYRESIKQGPLDKPTHAQRGHRSGT